MFSKSEMVSGYSLAILDLIKEENGFKKVYPQVLEIKDALEENPKFETILDSEIDSKNKILLIEKSFSNIHWSLINVAQMLALKKQFKYFKNVLNNLIKNLQEILKIEQGIVYSVQPITKTKLNKLEKKLSKKFGKKISLKNLIDKELIGGFKIILGSIVIEDSIESELNLIKKQLIFKEEEI